MTAQRMTTKDFYQTREAVTHEVRNMPSSGLMVLRLLNSLDRAPCLLRDRNGRGDRYLTLRYHCGDGQTKRVCLRGLEPKDETMLRAAVTGWWPSRSRVLTEAIHNLRARLRRNRQAALVIAERCGCRFHGTLLRVPRRKK